MAKHEQTNDAGRPLDQHYGLPARQEVLRQLPDLRSPDLDGSRGANRERTPGLAASTNAQTDVDAIEDWLATHANPHTRRAYRKEAYRLLLWAASYKRTPVSGLVVSDIREFLDWLGAPIRHPAWPSHWAVVRGPLTVASRRQARLILQTMFAWLVDAGYCARNPIKLLGKRQHGRSALDPTSVDTAGMDRPDQFMIERWLEPELWKWLLGFVETLPRDTLAREGRYQRLRFLLPWMYHVAPRRDELARGRMSHIGQSNGLWVCVIDGKGGRKGKVPIDAPALSALVEYRKFRGLPDYPQRAEKNVPIVSHMDGTSPVTGDQIYAALKWFFRRAAAVISGENPGWAAQLRAASPHWLRHTLASHAASAGIQIRTTADRLRHVSTTTTDKVYVHVALGQQAGEFADKLVKKPPK